MTENRNNSVLLALACSATQHLWRSYSFRRLCRHGHSGWNKNPQELFLPQAFLRRSYGMAVPATVAAGIITGRLITITASARASALQPSAR